MMMSHTARGGRGEKMQHRFFGKGAESRKLPGAFTTQSYFGFWLPSIVQRRRRSCRICSNCRY